MLPACHAPLSGSTTARVSNRRYPGNHCHSSSRRPGNDHPVYQGLCGREAEVITIPPDAGLARWHLGVVMAGIWHRACARFAPGSCPGSWGWAHGCASGWASSIRCCAPAWGAAAGPELVAAVSNAGGVPMFLSSLQGRQFLVVGVGADLDEGPDAVAAGGYVVEAAVEFDGDRLASGGAAEGEAGVANLAAGLDEPEAAEGACAGRARVVPGAAVPLPDSTRAPRPAAAPRGDRGRHPRGPEPEAPGTPQPFHPPGPNARAGH
jgi:hypothetical protein